MTRQELSVKTKKAPLLFGAFESFHIGRFTAFIAPIFLRANRDCALVFVSAKRESSGKDLPAFKRHSPARPCSLENGHLEKTRFLRFFRDCNEL